jgi:murein DD-endopeptidase MepM/ murein hydrolase activator NlpD
VIQAGDTLSGISLIYNTPIEELMALNPDTLPTQNATLHINDTIIINQPKSEVSIEHVERNYVDEDYDAEVIIIPRDDWYTTETNVIQQPSAGHHRAIVDQHFINDTESEREILIEEIDIEAVPKIMERGTKIPPTYIKPIYGGRISSYFGYRNAPTAGATTYHRGVDWAVATGTSVMASSGGTVTQAGWSGSYGYMILITHPGGTQTRYAHLSKIFVSVGQTVSQGEVIGKTGNTGRSTGPHLHFEILIGGSPVNPLNYIS